MQRLVPFSNGTAFTHWQANNCDRCSKYENESQSYDAAWCKAAFDIDMATICGSIRYQTALDIGHTGISGDYVRLNEKCKMFKNEDI